MSQPVKFCTVEDLLRPASRPSAVDENVQVDYDIALKELEEELFDRLRRFVATVRSLATHRARLKVLKELDDLRNMNTILRAELDRVWQLTQQPSDAPANVDYPKRNDDPAQSDEQKRRLIHVIQSQLSDFILRNKQQLIRDYPFLADGPIGLSVELFRSPVPAKLRPASLEPDLQ